MTSLDFTPDWGDRFWSKVCPEALSGCWLWHGFITPNGYGQFRVGGRNGTNINAHRYAFFLANGFYPKHFACHKCDVRACVNPSHLEDKTHSQNMADAALRGRIKVPKGEKHHQAKLTSAQVQAIRETRGTCKQLAAMFGVSRSQISNIRAGKQRTS